MMGSYIIIIKSLNKEGYKKEHLFSRFFFFFFDSINNFVHNEIQSYFINRNKMIPLQRNKFHSISIKHKFIVLMKTSSCSTNTALHKHIWKCAIIYYTYDT